MDDMQKIYKLKNEDGVRFVVDKTIDFSHHKQLKEINALRDNDWAHVHITDRTLSFNDTTYNLNSELSIDITVPKLVYGEEKRGNNLLGDEIDEDEDLEEENDDDEEEMNAEAENEWQIQSVQAMSMTSNMIALAQKGHQEFCFVVKPAPGSRRVNIVGYQ